MANVSFVIENLADAGTLSASSEVEGMEIEYLIESRHVYDEMWRALGTSVNFTLDFSADVMIDTIALLALNVTSAGTVRVRVSTGAGGSTSGDVLDQTFGSGDEEFDPDYSSLVIVMAQAAARYVRFDISDTSLDYIEAGRLVVGLREQIDYNFASGGITWMDPSVVTPSKGQQTLIWERREFRTIVLEFPWVSYSQRWDFIERLSRLNGRHLDVLVIVDPEVGIGRSLPQLTIWGLPMESTPINFTLIPDIYSKQISIKERL